MNRIPSSLIALPASDTAASRRAVSQIVREAVPLVADFCLVHFVTDGSLRCVAGAHSTSSGMRDMRALMKTHRVSIDDRHSTVADVVRNHRAILRRAIYPDDIRDDGGVVGQLHRKLAPTSALVVPILRGKAALGALSLCYSHSGRSYAARHIAAAKRLAQRIAAILTPIPSPDAASGLRAAARHTRQGTTFRRRVAARN